MTVSTIIGIIISIIGLLVNVLIFIDNIKTKHALEAAKLILEIWEDKGIVWIELRNTGIATATRVVIQINKIDDFINYYKKKSQKDNKKNEKFKQIMQTLKNENFTIYPGQTLCFPIGTDMELNEIKNSIKCKDKSFTIRCSYISRKKELSTDSIPINIGIHVQKSGESLHDIVNALDSINQNLSELALKK